MKDYTKTLPEHIEKYIGENDLFLEIFEGGSVARAAGKRPPLLFVHGAYTGSWMWSKYIPHFVDEGWKCYAMNLRGHYRSRVTDLTRVTFEDYLEDIREVIAECGGPPIVIGFSMGGMLTQKLAETAGFAGLVLIDSSISREVYEIAPYGEEDEYKMGIIEPAPAREETSSMDESPEDIAFQKKYLAMESSKAIGAYRCFHEGNYGVSINGALAKCPCLVIKAVNGRDDELRGKATAGQFHGEYAGFRNTTHTGLLVGQRYLKVVDRMLEWLKTY